MAVSRNIVLETQQHIPKWLFRWKVDIILYKTDEFNNHIEFSKKEYNVVFNGYQQLDFGSSRGSRDVSARLEIILKEDAIPEGFVDESRIILKGKRVFSNRKFDYKVDSVFRVFDKNGNFHHCVISGH